TDAAAFDAACAAKLTSAKNRIAQLKATPRPVPRADVARVLEIYDEAEADLDTIAGTADVVFNSNPDAAMRAAGEECQLQASALASEVTLDRGVYDVVSSLDLSGQDAAARYWIEQDLADFRRAGVNRDEATRARIKALRDEITAIGQSFARNINED